MIDLAHSECELCGMPYREHNQRCTGVVFMRREVRRCMLHVRHEGICMFRGLPINGRLAPAEQLAVRAASVNAT